MEPQMTIARQRRNQTLKKLGDKPDKKIVRIKIKEIKIRSIYQSGLSSNFLNSLFFVKEFHH